MTTTEDSKSAAIKLGTEYKDAQSNSVIIAAKCGEKLSEVRKELKKKGAYGEWVKESMPVGERSCQRFVELYDARPEYAKSDTAVSGLTDIISEINLSKLDKALEAEIRETIAEEKLGRTGINNLINEKTGKPVATVSILPNAIFKQVSAISKKLEAGNISIRDEKGLKKLSETLKCLEDTASKIRAQKDKFEEEQKAKSKESEGAEKTGTDG